MSSRPHWLSASFCVSVALVVAAAVAADPTSPTAGDALPVTVGLAADHAYLRAGPGDDFYPTERLTAGAEVEVWAIDASGYCAVRPVRGSFSWISARDVQAEAPLPAAGAAASRTGVVVTDGAAARVGSQLNDLRHVTQVALEAGERVTILEHVRIPDGRHAGDWVRIEPPSGEFRWARGEDLDLPDGLAVVPDPGPQPPPAGLAAAGEAVGAIRDAGTAVTQAVAEFEQAAAEPSGSGMTRLLSGWLPRGTNVFDRSPPPAPPPAVSAGAMAASGDELADIDLALSLAVTGPSDSWNLAPLRDRLRVASTRATAQADRTRAQAIDARLARFESIQARQKGLVAEAAPPEPLRLGGMWSSLSTLGSRPVRPGVLPGGRPAGGQPTWTPPDQMETSGRLATVISRRPDAPRWAVVDDANNVIAFVAPQPGVDLGPLVGQQVSVRGARGYMPEYKRPYLVASEARVRIASVPAPATRPDGTQ
ncbi:MAG: hypothetical protein ACKO4T_09705 [Planctomycetaceae bacterium]